MAYQFVPILHIVAGVLAIIELGLTAYLASVAQTPWGNFSPSQVNFMIFNSVWSLLVLAYVGLTPLYATRLFHKLASLALEALTMLFWFAGSIALAVLVGPGCGRGSWCGSAQAAIAFGFFLWIIFVVLVVLDALEAMRSRGHNTHAHKPAAYPGV